MFLKQNLTIKKDSELTNALNIQLSRINESMVPSKKKWAEAVMNYNVISLASYDCRFKQHEVVGQTQADNKPQDREFFTKEQRYGKYIVSTVVKEKCDQYIKEYSTRGTTSSSRFNQQVNSQFVAKKMNELFGSTLFSEAKTKAISDAVIKGTGLIRNRVYVDKDDKPTHFLEYVDIEDVYIDPCTSHVNEMFISSPYTDLDIIRLLPELESYLPNLYQNDPLVRIEANSKKEPISVQDMPFYKLGERMVDIYDMYESDRLTGLITGGKVFGNILDRWYSPQFLNGINHYYGKFNRYQGKYRINEYYKLVGKPRYIMYIGQYILLDLDYIPEGTLQDILCFFYSNKLPNDTVFGKSLVELVDTEFEYLNFLETKIKRILQGATSTLLMVNNKFLAPEQRNKPIKLDEITTVNIDTSTLSPAESGSGIGAPISPVNIVNPNLPLLMNERQNRLNNINIIIPSTEQLNLQQTKEQANQEYHSRDSDVNYFLLENSVNLSKFSNTVAMCVVNSLIFQSDDLIEDEEGEDNPKLLIVRQTKEETEETKAGLAELYNQRYLAQVEELKKKIQDSPEFQQKAGELSTNLGQLAQQKYSEAEPDMQKSLPFDTQQIQAKNFEQKTNEDIYSEIDNLLNQFLQEAIAKSGLKPIADNNIYIIVDEMIADIKKNRLKFEFTFDKSKAEIRKNIIEVLSVPNIFPTAQLAIKPAALLSAYLSTYDMDPDDSIDQEAPFGTEAQLALSKKQTVYLDPKNSPVAFFESFAKDNNIPIETLTDTNHPAYSALAKVLGIEQQFRTNLGNVAIAQDQLQNQKPAPAPAPSPAGELPRPMT
jgi:hypothetical protein